MNNDQNTINDMPYIKGPAPETMVLADELMTNDLAALNNKYGQKLFDKIFNPDENYFSAVDELKSRRQLIVSFFWPNEIRFSEFSLTKKRELLSFLAETQTVDDSAQFQINLKQIDQNLTLNQSVDLDQIKQLIEQSRWIKRAFDNIEAIIIDNFCHEYLPDTLVFYRLSPEKIKELEIEINSINDQLVKQLEKLEKNDFEKNPELIKKALDILGKLGRTKFFVAKEKEEQNLGQLIEIYTRLEIALTVNNSLRTKQIDNQSDINQIALAEIKTVLKREITI